MISPNWPWGASGGHGSRVAPPMKWGVLVNNQLWCNKNTISVLLQARTMCIFMHVIVFMNALYYMPKKWAFTFQKYCGLSNLWAPRALRHVHAVCGRLRFMWEATCCFHNNACRTRMRACIVTACTSPHAQHG